MNGFRTGPIRIIYVHSGVARFRDVSLARIAAVAFHRFKIGQQVVVTAFGVHTGPYEITRLNATRGGGSILPGQKLPNGPESAFSELSLRPMPESASRNGTQAAKSKSRGR